MRLACLLWCVVHVVVCSCSGESDLEGSRRSSMDHPPAVQMRRLSTLPRDPRDSRVDLRRMSLYLEPGTWRLPSDRAALPPSHPRRFSMGPDSYTQPYRMTDSLTEIQGDIQRLANQQQQIQSMMHNGMTPQTNQGMQQPPPHGQFYLHDQVSLKMLLLSRDIQAIFIFLINY